MTHTKFCVLREIQERDPDGWESREPTKADREAFREWAIRTHGELAWKEYSGTDWDTRGAHWSPYGHDNVV